MKQTKSKTCRFCNEEFYPKTGQEKECSEACKKAYAKQDFKNKRPDNSKIFPRRTTLDKAAEKANQEKLTYGQMKAKELASQVKVDLPEWAKGERG